MRKEDFTELLELFDAEILQALYLLANAFSKEELIKISKKVQNKSVKKLIINYL